MPQAITQAITGTRPPARLECQPTTIFRELNTVPYNGPIYNGQELVAHTRIGGPGVPILSSNEEPGFLFGFGSWHPGVCNFVFADGSTRPVRNSVDTVLLGILCHRNDGQIVDSN